MRRRRTRRVELSSGVSPGSPRAALPPGSPRKTSPDLSGRRLFISIKFPRARSVLNFSFGRAQGGSPLLHFDFNFGLLRRLPGPLIRIHSLSSSGLL